MARIIEIVLVSRVWIELPIPLLQSLILEYLRDGGTEDALIKCRSSITETIGTLRSPFQSAMLHHNCTFGHMLNSTFMYRLLRIIALVGSLWHWMVSFLGGFFVEIKS